MYRAKSKGRGRHEVFVPEMHRAAIERLDLEADLRRAIHRDELVLHYQPIVDVRTGRLSGVEALLRWNHPSRGLTAPDVFIPLAEDLGLIDELGAWVLDTACTQAKAWQRLQGPGEEPLKLSVNLSPRQLRDDGLVDGVARVLARSGLDPAALTLEITEGAMMQDTETALTRLNELKHLGVHLSVDDFGTGYSSLSYLQRFPIDELKVDRTFTQRIDQGPEESSLARAIVKLAQTLRLRAVAEGVETPTQLDVLRELGCEYAQGFLLHRPLAADRISLLLHGQEQTAQAPSPAEPVATALAQP
jgi:EAL domain-containing protein (putative c-di-GMP-specific phosphodiesterase class I)